MVRQPRAVVGFDPVMSWRVNHRARTFRIARALQQCGRCCELTPVVGLLLPVGHETLAGDGEGGSAVQAWHVAEEEALLFFLEHVPQRVRIRLQRLAPNYSLDQADGTADSYWMNHCTQCGSRQDDFELYCEPEGAFAPMSASAARAICLHWYPEPVEACAMGYACAPPYFSCAQRRQQLRERY